MDLFFLGGVYSLSLFLLGVLFGWKVGTYLPPMQVVFGGKVRVKEERPMIRPAVIDPDLFIKPPDPFKQFVQSQIPPGLSEREEKEMKEWFDSIENPIQDWTEQ